MSPITQTPIPLSDEWATPKWLFDHFDAEFHFTLDAAAKPWNAKCEKFLDGTGLGNSWGDATVWLNPPYSNIDAWLAKARKSVRLTGSTVVALVPCTPDRKWWSEHVEDEASEVRLLTRSLLPSGRVHFEREDGTSGRAPFPSCVLIYRPSVIDERPRPIRCADCDEFFLPGQKRPCNFRAGFCDERPTFARDR